MGQDRHVAGGAWKVPRGRWDVESISPYLQPTTDLPTTYNRPSTTFALFSILFRFPFATDFLRDQVMIALAGTPESLSK